MAPKRIIGLMGPDHGPNQAKHEAMAFELGKAVAEAGHVLLTGGRSRGVMDAASKGAKSAGGLTIGILPTCDLSEASEAIDIPILTGMGSARDNINVLSSHVIVAISMGPGTSAEVSLALKAGKSVVLLDVEPEAKAFFTTMAPQQVLIAADVAAAQAHITALLAASS